MSTIVQAPFSVIDAGTRPSTSRTRLPRFRPKKRFPRAPRGLRQLRHLPPTLRLSSPLKLRQLRQLRLLTKKFLKKFNYTIKKQILRLNKDVF